MNNRAPQAIPAQLTESKGANLFRELFMSNFWMSGVAMLKYIPRSFRGNDVVRMGKLLQIHIDYHLKEFAP